MMGNRNKKSLILLGLLFVMLFGFFGWRASFAENWQEKKSDHFIVYFLKDESFAKSVLDRAEEDYGRIATELGYPRYSDFWTWDKRVKIYIYADHDSFIKATNQPDWSHGMADYTNKQIISFVWSEGFLESLLPHEMAHLIFRDFVGFKGEVPLWLDEGVAQWAEKDKRLDMKNSVKQLYDNETLLSLKDMMKNKPSDIKDHGKTYILTTLTKKGEKVPLILGSDNFVNIYYLQAFALVDFLTEKFGATSFGEFCRQLRDGKSLEEALQFAYPAHIRSLADLEMGWRKYMAEH